MQKVEIMVVYYRSDTNPDYVLKAAWDFTEHYFTDYFEAYSATYVLPDEYSVYPDACGLKHIYPVNGGTPCELFCDLATGRPAFSGSLGKKIVLRQALEDLDPVRVIETITRDRSKAEEAVKNGAAKDLYTPAAFVQLLRDSAAEGDKPLDYEALQAQAEAGELKWPGARNGSYQGVPFVWLRRKGSRQ